MKPIVYIRINKNYLGNLVDEVKQFMESLKKEGITEDYHLILTIDENKTFKDGRNMDIELFSVKDATELELEELKERVNGIWDK